MKQKMRATKGGVSQHHHHLSSNLPSVFIFTLQPRPRKGCVLVVLRQDITSSAYRAQSLYNVPRRVSLAVSRLGFKFNESRGGPVAGNNWRKFINFLLKFLCVCVSSSHQRDSWGINKKSPCCGRRRGRDATAAMRQKKGRSYFAYGNRKGRASSAMLRVVSALSQCTPLIGRTPDKDPLTMQWLNMPLLVLRITCGGVPARHRWWMDFLPATTQRKKITYLGN